ncbi:hypothetical protein [Cellulomonas sp. ATA003]|uniref:hypothetical protein n=1 Tax=Cellulomonas sp. ATA003 TaxID=3073064 RepID=UPI002873F1B1|nr:hypothetical protein [Cellulomonas sp. ATA003]WNB85669.1 hypothetical protein REH70_19500 [Cellulomonas sp. ATA003]
MVSLRVPTDFPIATVAGVDVVLESVDVLPDGLEIRWHGVPGDATERMDRDWETAMGAWTERRDERGPDGAGAPPTMPGTLLARIQAHLTDDVGTEYTPRTGRAAGSDSAWESAWRFTPAPPAEARHLRLDLAVDGERVTGCDLP